LKFTIHWKAIQFLIQPDGERFDERSYPKRGRARLVPTPADQIISSSNQFWSPCGKLQSLTGDHRASG